MLLLPVSALAAERLALVVGNDGYRNVSKLANARNDARLMAQLLREAHFEVTLAEDLGRTDFWRAVDTLKARIRKGDEVVVFYAGHGVQLGSDPVLLPVDIQAENEDQLARDGVAVFRLQEALKDARAAVIIIDACRDNPFPKQGTRSLGATRGLAPVEAAEGMAILMSAGRGQTALDGLPGQSASNGLFTQALVQTLRNPAIGMRAALLEVRDRVEDAARRVGHSQRPALVDEMRGDFRLFAGPLPGGAPRPATLALAGDPAGARTPGAAEPAAAAPSGGAAPNITLNVNVGAPVQPAAAPPAAPPVALPPTTAALPRKVKLLWDTGPRGATPTLGATTHAEVEAAFVKALLAADIPLTLPDAARQDTAGDAPNASHVLTVTVLADARSPLGVGFRMTVKSAAAQDYLFSHYAQAKGPTEPPPRKFTYVAGDTGFRKVEITEAPVIDTAELGRALADEVKAALKRALQ